MRSINSRNFYLQAALDDLQQVNLSHILEISRQYFLLPTNCAKFISRHAASQHVTYVMSKARVFLSGNHRHTRFQFPFGTSVETNFLVSTLTQPFTFPSLKFEYWFSVLVLPTRKLEERVICFFTSSRKAKRFLVHDQPVEQIKISFVAISKYW